MLTVREGWAQALEDGLREMVRMRQLTGPAGEFWAGYLSAAAKITGATRGYLLLRDAAQPDRLKKLAEWSASGQGHASPAVQLFLRSMGKTLEETVTQGQALLPLSGSLELATDFSVAALVPLPAGAREHCVVACLVEQTAVEQARESLARLRLVADVPAAYRQQREIEASRQEAERFASVLDTLVLVNQEKRFLSAALSLCNALATRFRCERVTLGWLDGGYVRLQAISRVDRFDKHMAAVKAIEVLMEESLDQDDEIVWPAPESSKLVAREHAQYSRDQSASNLCSVPLRGGGKPVAVLTCERAEGAFTEAELEQLRLAADQTSARLMELKRVDRWFGSRWAAAGREALAGLLGPEKTWAKLGVLAGAAGLVVLFLPIFNYRAEGSFILRSGDVAFLTSPFDGYISQSTTRPGDVVSSNAVLLKLDTSDLELEEANAVAEVNRYLREAEKARADAERLRAAGRVVGLADMRINQALAEQAQKRLEILRFRLRQAELRAPFDSIVVEGDLRQRLGSPVKLGDPLFRLAKLNPIYVEAEIEENDVHEILEKSTGEIAFVTQPKLKFPIRIQRIEPAALPKEGKNVFVVRCELAGRIEPWWRPGMSGVCKINVEKRTLWWILTHRTADFLRLFFWW